MLWRSEFRNTLTSLVRRRALAVEDAIPIAQETERLMAGREYSAFPRDTVLPEAFVSR